MQSAELNKLVIHVITESINFNLYTSVSILIALYMAWIHSHQEILQLGGVLIGCGPQSDSLQHFHLKLSYVKK